MRKRNEPLSLLFLHLGLFVLWILFGDNSAETQGRYLTKVRFIGQVICDNVSQNEKGDIIMARTAEITFKEFRRRYNSEDACRAELFRLRFPNGFVCPKCGCVE